MAGEGGRDSVAAAIEGFGTRIPRTPPPKKSSPRKTPLDHEAGMRRQEVPSPWGGREMASAQHCGTEGNIRLCDQGRIPRDF